MYMNKSGFKCVDEQLAKTEGRDPQEYEELKRRHSEDKATFKTEVEKLKVRKGEYV